MGGGLLQLVAYGAQDIYLTGNPQITYFKVVYRRHTNFAMESIEQTFNGTAKFGQRATCTIARNGDLMYRTYLRVVLPEVTPTGGNNFRWLNWIGHILAQEITLEIGGQEIDKQYGEWLHIWNELSQKPGQQANYANLVGNVPALVQPSTSTKPAFELYIPLQFFFCRTPGLALPLIALQYHEVKIIIQFQNLINCYWSENGTETVGDFSASLWVDYIFLDTDERRRFAQKSHEYLIEQLQTTGSESILSTSNRINMGFNHPVKELVWIVQKDSHVNSSVMQSVGGIQWFNFTDRVDTTNFSGTPADPYGGGIGGAAFSGMNPFASMPLSGNTYAPNSGVLANTNIAAPAIYGNYGNVNIDSLTFYDLFGNGNSAGSPGAGVAYSSNLPFFDAGKNPTAFAKIQFNGQDRFTERTGRYFNHVQPYQHHTNGPATGINVYSFALTPEDHQPSGTSNFSRIDKATLQLTTTTATLQTEAESSNPLVTTTSGTAKCRIYALNYNVLRIMSGMGGLAYAN
jgi:hypothetical protein